MSTQQRVRTRNYRKFYALLGQMPGADRESLVKQFTGSRTANLRGMKDTEYAVMLAAMEYSTASVKGGYAEYSLWRRRVMAAIGAWLRSRNMPEDAGRIKAIACRAAKTANFKEQMLQNSGAINMTDGMVAVWLSGKRGRNQEEIALFRQDKELLEAKRDLIRLQRLIKKLTERTNK
jgi:hypothetical protein